MGSRPLPGFRIPKSCALEPACLLGPQGNLRGKVEKVPRNQMVSLKNVCETSIYAARRKI